MTAIQSLALLQSLLLTVQLINPRTTEIYFVTSGL